MQVLVDELKVRTEKIKLGRSDGRHIDTAVTLNTFITVMLFSPLPTLVKLLCLPSALDFNIENVRPGLI